ncbi:FMN-binding protein [Senegalia massiliensis]|uniref:FMN-binding protein n=1 Tax=Senegalia massiliensis TaxID=1720316 RepID=UPI001F5F71C3|nr:FMN-binding protein [Senegalia massiliensis]
MKKFIKLLSISLLMFIFVGCSNGDAETSKNDDKNEEKADATSQASQEVTEIELEWDIQPDLGIIKGDYYRVEERFRQGHLGILEVVKNEDEIVNVEFNELGRPNYYVRYYQNVPKRMSEYNFTMGAKKGAAWIQSVVLVEEQMLEEQRITGKFDTISGASNSVNQSMLPLAKEISKKLDKPSGQKYYSIAEDLGGGLTGYLKVVLEDKKIVSVKYDEIFANTPEEIEDPKLKKLYRQSKYESVEYEEPSRIGFNVQMDALNEKVIETQDLLDLSGLPSTDETGDYASSGFTIRNESWDNYLKLAEKLKAEIEKDGNIL